MLESPMVNTDTCLTVIQFAEKAGVTRQAVNKMIKQGRVKAELFGKTYLIDKQQLEQYLADRNR